MMKKTNAEEISHKDNREEAGRVAQGGADNARLQEPKLSSQAAIPQIAKGEGDAPVQAYLAAIPGWKRTVGKRIDALIDARHATRAQGDQMEFRRSMASRRRCGSSRFIATRSTSRSSSSAAHRSSPMPPDTSTQPDVRYLNIYEDTPLDEAQFSDWVKQASKLPGLRM